MVILTEESTVKLEIKQAYDNALLNKNTLIKMIYEIKCIFADLSKLGVSPSDHQQDRILFLLADQMEKQSLHNIGT